MSASQAQLHGEALTPSRRTRWTGAVLSAIPALIMSMNALEKLVHKPSMVTFMARLGIAEDKLVAIGVLELTCAIIFLIPRTSVLGAVLLAAYFGGATATLLRVGRPGVGPVVLGILAWVGLYLREPRLRALAPFRR